MQDRNYYPKNSSYSAGIGNLASLRVSTCTKLKMLRVIWFLIVLKSKGQKSIINICKSYRCTCMVVNFRFFSLCLDHRRTHKRTSKFIIYRLSNISLTIVNNVIIYFNFATAWIEIKNPAESLSIVPFYWLHVWGWCRFWNNQLYDNFIFKLCLSY